MSKELEKEDDKYEIVIRKIGRRIPVETDIMNDREIQTVLYCIGMLNLRNS